MQVLGNSQLYFTTPSGSRITSIVLSDCGAITDTASLTSLCDADEDFPSFGVPLSKFRGTLDWFSSPTRWRSYRLKRGVMLLGDRVAPSDERQCGTWSPNICLSNLKT